MSELQQAINEMRNMRESYDQLVSQNAQLAANVQAIKDAHILGFNVDGIVFSEGFVPHSLMEFAFNKDKIIEIHDDKCEIIKNMTSAEYPEIEVIDFQEGEFVPGAPRSFMQNSQTLRVFRAPNHTNTYGLFCLAGCPQLREINVLHSTGNEFDGIPPETYNIGINCARLIDFITGAGFTSSARNLAGWSPAIALEDSDTSLLTDEDIAAGFTSNLQKLLWNIRNHIAANLPTITAGYSIKFSAAVKAAILADQETADAFTNKGWTIA